jgi:MarR family transcriptional regulator, temperature-dependent positive regulator of motility
MLNGAQRGGSVLKTIETVSDRLEQHREEVRFKVLRLIENKPKISQRELADELGVSLGQINYQLKALRERGLIKVGNFIRSDNKLAYIYLLTPKGAADKLVITKRFLIRKRQEFELLKAELDELEKEVKKR